MRTETTIDSRASTARPRVLLVDDHALLLDALERLFSDEWNIVGKIDDARCVLHAAETMLPDVVILDVAMPFSNGLELARKLKGKCPDTRLVFLTMSEDPDIAAEAFRMGASAYVLKSLAASELSRVMRDVHAGKHYIAPSLAQTVVHSLVERPEDDSKGLTDRQKDVLRLITRGLTMKEVAAALNISTRTVAFHKYQMMRQLGIATSAELIQYAVRRSMH